MKKKEISKWALVADNGDGLFLAVWAGKECIFLGDYSGREREAGHDFAACGGNNVWRAEVESWEEPAWLLSMFERAPHTPRAAVRQAVVDEVLAEGNGGYIYESHTGQVPRDSAAGERGTSLHRALEAAGVLSDFALFDLIFRADELRDKAEKEADAVRASTPFANLDCALLDVLDKYTAAFRAAAESAEAVEGHGKLALADLPCVVNLLEDINGAVFVSGCMGVHFRREVERETWRMDVECAPEIAESVELWAERVNPDGADIIGKGRYQQRAAELDVSLLQLALSLCHVSGEIGDCERDKEGVSLYVDLCREGDAK